MANPDLTYLINNIYNFPNLTGLLGLEFEFSRTPEKIPELNARSKF